MEGQKPSTERSFKRALRASLICCCGASAQTILQISGQQPMEKMLTRLTPHRQASCPISARLETTLDRFANPQVFVLNASADRNTLLVIFASRFAHVRKVEIKDHSAMVYIQRQHKVCIQVAFVTVDHEIWILPEIPGAITFAGRACR